MKEKNTIQQLIDSREAIKRKFKLIKRDNDGLKKAVEKTFEPIINPLQKLVTLNGNEETTKIKKVKVSVNSTDEKKMKDPVELSSDISDNDDNSQDEDFNTADEANSTIDDFDATITSQNSHPIGKNNLSLLKEYKKNELDPWYGVRKVGNKLMIGRENIRFEDNTIGVRNAKYAKTEGLMQLLFRNDPNNDIVSEEDKQNYKQILEHSHGHRVSWSKDKPIRSFKNNKKYAEIIVPLFNIRKSKRKSIPTFKVQQYNKSLKKTKNVLGQGIFPDYKVANPESMIDYVYWDDPNELIDRLRILMAEQTAGNYGHTNEIVTIISELREAGYIY